MVNAGWVKLWRQLLESDIWEDETATRLFIVLLLLADREGIVKRSVKDLADLCRTAKTTCYDALRRTVAYDVANVEPNGKRMTITILNWDKFQAKPERSTERSTERTPNDDRTIEPGFKNVRKKEVKETVLRTVAKAEYGDPNINQLIGLWQEVYLPLDGSIQRNRFSASNLLKKQTLEKLKQIIRFLPSIAGDQYAPKITSFMDLEQKLSQLALYAKKKGDNGRVAKIR
jgi:hypothetical protein